jgi:hypothetical protein
MDHLYSDPNIPISNRTDTLVRIEASKDEVAGMSSQISCCVPFCCTPVLKLSP